DRAVGLAHKGVFMGAVLLGIGAADATGVVDRVRDRHDRTVRIETRECAVGSADEPAGGSRANAVGTRNRAGGIDAHRRREAPSRGQKTGLKWGGAPRRGTGSYFIPLRHLRSQ